MKMNREEYLLKANEIMRQGLFKDNGFELPEDVQISVGFPLGYRASSKMQTVGQCFSRVASDNNVNNIYINPTQDNTLQVLGILVHEDVHAIDDCQNGHKKAFRDIAVKVGLTGKMRSTTESEELKKYFEDEIISKLGEYPHKKQIVSNRKKQNTRNLKMECIECGFSWRASKTMISRMTNFDCNGCESGVMHDENMLTIIRMTEEENESV